MTDQTAPTTLPAAAQPAGDTITCSECLFEVPALDYCVRCGDPLDDEKRARTALTGRRKQFAAQPDEHALGVHVISTLFPQLPRADMATFRIVLAIGFFTIVGLAAAGFFPLALIAAALLVPLMMVLYVWDVDVYEDEPIRVMGFTAAWGIAAGIIAGLLVRLLPAGEGVLGNLAASDYLGRGILVPLVSGLAMLAGPLILLPYRKFNDVLDGATFGATSAVAFTAALVLSQGADLFTGGRQPAMDRPAPVARDCLAAHRGRGDRCGHRRLVAALSGPGAGPRSAGSRRPAGDRHDRRVAVPGGRCGGPAGAAVPAGALVAHAAGGSCADLAAVRDPSGPAPGSRRDPHRTARRVSQLRSPDPGPQLLRRLRRIAARGPEGREKPLRSGSTGSARVSPVTPSLTLPLRPTLERTEA